MIKKSISTDTVRARPARQASPSIGGSNSEHTTSAAASNTPWTIQYAPPSGGVRFTARPNTMLCPATTAATPIRHHAPITTPQSSSTPGAATAAGTRRRISAAAPGSE
ncbi:MAG: hypothetical protein IPL39_06485 [Opitutaceae bacterium]|nr:hypothetical protein [Opitutaceae bacterium]